MVKKLRKIIALLLAAATLAGMTATACATGTDSGQKLVAITFDDGPSVYTPKLLDALKERGVKATFFVLGNRAERYADTVKRIINEGHQLASHTYDHSNLALKKYDQIVEQIYRTADIFTALGGDGDYMVRLPYGSCDDEVRAAARDTGVPLINWSVDSLDWQYLNATKTTNKILSYTGDGSIILLHDIHSPSVTAAIRVIDILLARGYEFVTVEELLLRRGITPQGGVTYYHAPNVGINLGPEAASPEYFDESNVESHWGYESLEWGYEKSLLSKGENGEYYPNKYMTRAEFIEALGKVYGVFPVMYPTQGWDKFDDVPANASYAPYLRWAVEWGIINGDGEGHFNPDNKITRQETAACLERFMKNCMSVMILENTLNGKETTVDKATVLQKYKDASQIAEWAVEPVLYCSESGVFAGSTNGLFMPRGNMTRAQGVTVLQRINTLLGK